MKIRSHFSQKPARFSQKSHFPTQMKPKADEWRKKFAAYAGMEEG